MRQLRSVLTLGGLLATVVLFPSDAVRGETNRWESIGQMPLYGGNQGVHVYGLAFGPGGTLFAANSLGV